MISSPIFKDVEARRTAYLTETQRSWLDKARQFADRMSLSDIVDSDEKNIFRRDLFELACKEGLGALPFPGKYGGSDGDYLSFCLVNEEFGRRCVPIMSSLGVHVLCQEPVYRFGTDAQKQHYLTRSSTGEYLAAFGLTEPGAGSDTAALACKARLTGDNYILNGTKVFITSGAASDYFIVMARLFDGEQDLGITAFIVDKTFAGCQIGQKFDMLGMRGYATCELVFEDCVVPRSNLLGEHGQGRKVALSSLAKGRVTIAAQATGWAQGALEIAARLLAEQDLSRSEHDFRLASLGELVLQVEAARVLTYQSACAIDRGEGDITLAAMAKIQATDIAMRAATEALSLSGLPGAKPDYLLERIFRDAKAGQIYEGTNQIQRMLIARDLVKK
jgi:alkylation response protein AidB-like acyl-CoA dehydrogenase